MSDPTQNVGDFPQMPSFDSTYLDEADVVIEDAPAAAATPEELAELKKKLEEQNKQIEELKRSGDTATAVREGIANLAQNLRVPQTASVPAGAPAVVQQSGESDEEFRKRVDAGLLERGASATVEEIWMRQLRPEVQRLAQSNITNSRRFVVLDPSRGPLYQKYRAEVEQMVAGLPPEQRLYNPEVYEQVVDRVASIHAEEILNERVQAAVAKERETLAAATAAATAAAQPGAPAVHAQIGARPGSGAGGAPAGKTTLRLTPAEAAYAHAHLIPEKVYAEWLVRKGVKK